MKYKIFTYGTLMKGERNHYFLKDSRYICDGVLKDYCLKETGSYPAAIKKEGFKVYGEIYETDEDTKKRVDYLEGTGYLYDCVKVKVETEKGEEEVYFYEYLQDVSKMKTRKPEGKWRPVRNDLD